MLVWKNVAQWIDRMWHRKLIRHVGEAFDTEWYINQYPDVATSWRHPLVHYLKHGRDEGRSAKKPQIDRAALATAQRVVAELYEIDASQGRDGRVFEVASLPLSPSKSAGLLVKGVNAFLAKVRSPVGHVTLASSRDLHAKSGEVEGSLWIVTDGDYAHVDEDVDICQLSDILPTATNYYRLALLDTILRLLKPSSIRILNSKLGRKLYETLPEGERKAWSHA